MWGNAGKADAEFRRDDRFQVDYATTAEHRVLGSLTLRIVDVSSTGAMIDGTAGIARGDKIRLHLPPAINVEALCIWTWHQHAGLQFDQSITISQLAQTFDVMKTSPSE